MGILQFLQIHQLQEPGLIYYHHQQIWLEIHGLEIQKRILVAINWFLGFLPLSEVLNTGCIITCKYGDTLFYVKYGLL